MAVGEWSWVSVVEDRGRVSLLAETRFTTYFCKHVDLRVWIYAHVPRGRGVSGTWRETRRNGPQAMGEARSGVPCRSKVALELYSIGKMAQILSTL
jgi:hypothetical protein